MFHSSKGKKKTLEIFSVLSVAVFEKSGYTGIGKLTTQDLTMLLLPEFSHLSHMRRESRIHKVEKRRI